MCRRSYRNILLCDVYADGKTLCIYIREVLLSLLCILVCDVKAHMVKGMNLHLVVDGTSHDVTRSKTETLIIFLHELLTIRQTENTSVTTHGLCYEIGRVSLLWVEQYRWVELYKLHVLHLTLGTINHGYTVTCGDAWVGCCLIDGTSTTSCHKRYL